MLRALAVPSREEFAEELSKVSVDSSCIDIFLDKKDSFLVKIDDLATPAANILKQTALSLGADVAVHREVITGKIERSDAIFMGTKRQLKRLSLALSGQPFDLAGLEQKVNSLLGNLSFTPSDLDLPGGTLSFTRPVVVGVLNITPDSFSDGGTYLEPRAACTRIDEIYTQGADIADIGAESTRPGSDSVSASEQLSRLNPVFDYLEGKNYIWSVDTTDPEVAKAALDKGASMVNDVSGGAEPELWTLARHLGAADVLMHIMGTPKDMQEDPCYEDFGAELYEFFCEKIEQITSSGLEKKCIVIDPGIGFGKRVEDNTSAIRRLGELKGLGCPVMVGASRKSFLGSILDLDVEERVEPSVAVAVMAYLNGANLLRVHDVGQTRKALDAAHAVGTFGGES